MREENLPSLTDVASFLCPACGDSEVWQSTALVSYSWHMYKTPRWTELPRLSSRRPRLYHCALFLCLPPPVSCCCCWRTRLCSWLMVQEQGRRQRKLDSGSQPSHPPSGCLGAPHSAWEAGTVTQGWQRLLTLPVSGGMAAYIRGRNTHSASVLQIWKDGTMKLIFFIPQMHLIWLSETLNWL